MNDNQHDPVKHEFLELMRELEDVDPEVYEVLRDTVLLFAGVRGPLRDLANDIELAGLRRRLRAALSGRPRAEALVDDFQRMLATGIQL